MTDLLIHIIIIPAETPVYHSVEEEIAGVNVLELINVFVSSLGTLAPTNLANTMSMQ